MNFWSSTVVTRSKDKNIDILWDDLDDLSGLQVAMLVIGIFFNKPSRRAADYIKK
jgi:hypothetical protein